MRVRLLILLTFLAAEAMAQNESLSKIDSLLTDAKFSEVIDFINRNPLQSNRDAIQFNCKKAEALISLGRFDEAINILKESQSITSSNETYRANIEALFGFLYLNQGKNDLALEYLLKATATFQQRNESKLEEAKALSYLGNLYVSTGKYSQAEEQLQMVLTIRLKQLPETHELIAAAYNDLGLVYSQLDVDKSFDYYQKALTLYEKIHGENHPKLAIANTNLGVLNRSEKLYGDAINYFESALKIWEKIYPQPHPNKALVLMNLGQTYSSMGDQKAALEFFEKARAMYELCHGKKHPDLAYVYNLLGNEKVAQKKYDEGLADYQRALIANTPDFNSENISINPSVKNFYQGNQFLYSLMYKAQALESQYAGKTLKDIDLQLAIQTLQSADTLIDKLRQRSTNESDKLTLGAISNEVYADGVRIAFTLSDVAIRNRKLFREISFYFAEKSKSAVLLESISDTNAKDFAKIPKELTEEEKNIKSSIALVVQKLAQKPSEQEEKLLRETLFTLNRNYEAFIKQLEANYPEYFNLKYNSTSPSISQIQNLLSASTAVLSYFIDDKNSRLYSFLISKNKFTIIDRTLPQEYDRYLTGLRNGLYYMDLHTFALTSRELGKLLIPKGIRSSIHDLVIVPTGRMSVIPFETLLTNRVKKENYSELPYLLRKYSIRYEFSAGLAIQKKQSAQAVSSILLCAPVNFSIRDNLPDLPGTEIETNTIADLFTKKSITSKILSQNNANEATIKSGMLKNYSFIHFATHGVVDENKPELSRIYLKNTNDAEDGNLYAGEIYNLELNASLVTLSACQTGLGKISKGEGVIGLSRALVYAGAKNIIVSFWSVADESTSQLMTDFYSKVLENRSINLSENLRQAKLQLMKGEYSAPYYWAPFILIGF